MADVRLTATNPEDSSVVPVACNAKGELLLEEPTLASDDYVAVTGDNMTGDLTLGTDKITLDATDGNAVFAGDISVGPATTYNAETIKLANNGYCQITRNSSEADYRLSFNTSAGEFIQCSRADDVSPTFAFEYDGHATFRGELGNVELNNVLGLQVYRKSAEESDSMLSLYSDLLGVSCKVRVTVDGKVQIGTNVGGANTTGVTLNPEGTALFTDDVTVGSRNEQWMLVESNGLCHMVKQTRASTADLVATAAAEYPPLRNVFAELDAVEKALGDVMEKLRMNPPAGWEVWDGSSENS